MSPISLPVLDPVALSLGPIDIRWYSLAYIAGILFTLFWLKKSNDASPKFNNGKKLLSEKAYDDWLIWAIVSIILGGRLGYVLFYNPAYFLKNPAEIFAIWHGGMSFHGGLLGSILGMWLFARKYEIDFLRLTDTLSVAAPLGLFFGRLANFVNMELYGRVTDSAFGIIFPNAGDLPRHPSQLYEAFSEGLVTFIVMILLWRYSKFSQQRGFLSGMFLTLYGSSRILVENFREPDQQIGFIFFEITMGQVLSLPIIFLGIFMIFFRQKDKKNLA